MIFTEILEPKLIPKAIRDDFTDFKETEKSSQNNNHISFRATSKKDDKPYIIRALNIHSNLYKTNKSQSIKLYLQELFYLSARFGRNQGDIDSTDEILLFKKFEVGDDGAMGFVMRDISLLSEGRPEKDSNKAICIEDLAKQILSDMLFINSRFGICDIDLSLENICCFEVQNDLLHSKQGVSTNFFITNWEKGKVNNSLVDSTISLSTTSTESSDGLNDSKINTLENMKTGSNNFETDMLKNTPYQCEMSSWIYSLGLLMLEVAGMPRSLWKDLSKLQNHKNYDIILEFMIQSLSREYGQSSSSCSLVSGMLSKEPDKRVFEIKQRLLPLQNLPSTSLNDTLIRVSELFHPLFPCTELHGLIKQFESNLRKTQVQLLIILETLYKEKTPNLLSMEAGKCIEDCLKYIFKKVHMESQPLNKILHPKVKSLLDMDNPQELKEISLEGQLISDLGASLIGKCTKWKNLQDIQLFNNQISDSGLTDMTENKTWTNLEQLDLRANLITEEGAKMISLNQSWSSLRQLYLFQNRIGDEGAKKIARNTIWTNLAVLDLACNFISDEGAVAIGGNVTWKMLQILHLYENEIGSQGACSLARNTTWKNLKELDLEKNKIGYEGAIAIAKNSNWIYLRNCYLSGNLFGEKDIAFILENNTWKKIRRLIVKYECIKLGGFCQTCKKALKDSFPHCYSFQKNVYYCIECVERIESMSLDLKSGLRKSIDPHALIFIEADNKPMLNKILAKRIGDQVKPNDCQPGEDFSFHRDFCDLCFCTIGKSTRWKCLNCKNVDVCDKCYLLSKKREPQNVVILKIRGHDVDSHILQRYLFVEKSKDF